MRIAVGGFHLEASNYNPALSRIEDFRIVVRGADLLALPAFQFLSGFAAEFVPTLYARAVPGAPMARETYDLFKSEILAGIAAAGPLDGVYLCMHGATFVEGMEDAEADFISAVRAAVGPDLPISVSYDLHGNVSQGVIDAIDMFTAYRTAPHIDAIETQQRAVAMLVRAIETGEKPAVCWAKIPVVLPGERTATTDEPAKGLYARLGPIEAANPGIWDAALMVGYIWADEPRVTACAIMTGTDRAAMQQAATDLAAAYWAERENFEFGSKVGSIAETVDWALGSPTGPVVLADSGDNPTAGGSGDRAEMLAALIEAKATNVQVVAITDRPATEAAIAAGVGATLPISIGATLHPEGSTPVGVSAEVVHVVATESPLDREALLRIGGIDLVVSARRRPYHTFEDFARVGLDPRDASIVLVKSGYLSPELQGIANPSLMALSPGIVDQAVERLPRERTSRPLYPLDLDFSFTPAVVWSARSA
ncbi:MAG: M81 family metallopeptidase [Devosia sp.]